MKYKRIIILGGSGSGKSTLANRIGLHTNYPVYHLDNLLLNKDWSQKEKSGWLTICKNKFLSKDIGVVDGNYSFILEERIQWADLIIYIDVPTYVQVYNIFKRMIGVNLGLEKRYGAFDDRKEKIDFKFFTWVLFWNRGHRKNMIEKLKSTQGKKVVVTDYPRKLNVEELLGDAM